MKQELLQNDDESFKKTFNVYVESFGKTFGIIRKNGSVKVYFTLPCDERYRFKYEM